MSTSQIVTLADEIVKGGSVKIPAMKFYEWDQVRWWIDYLKGYSL